MSQFPLARSFAFALILLALVGCDSNKTSEHGSSVQLQRTPSPGISIYELGRNLGYTVTTVSFDSAKLVSGSNTLVVYTDPRSEVYYNGYRVVKTSGIANRSGVFSVPPELPGQLRQVLPAGAVSAPAYAGSAALRSVGPVRGRVVIDPGHGGKDPGAQAGGITEKNLTLELSKMVADELRRRGVTVTMTRNNDTFVELDERTTIANTFRADLFVAIHADVNPSSDKVGHTIILPQSGNWKATQAGRDIDRDMIAHGSPSHMVRMDNRGLYVLRHTDCPAILVEVGFLSNATEASRFRDPAYRRKVAMGIADGIIDYLQHK